MPDLITEKIAKLGFGYMRLPRKGGGFDSEQINRMADAFLDSGGSYFDAAFVYEGAEAALRESVIKRYPRERVHIATKLNLNPIDAPEQMDKQFNTSLARLGTDYVDFYLLHGIDSIQNEKAEKLGAWSYLSGLKAKGSIRHMGFSFHGAPEELEEILTKHPEAEFCQLQINYLDWNNPKVNSRKLYEIARKFNVPIIIMEPVKGGMLTGAASPIAELLRDANPNASMASWALRYAMQLEGVLVTLSGMSSFEQLTDNIATFTGFSPLSNDELAVLDKAVEILEAVPRVACTECRYCVNDCPSNIPIPVVIEAYNNYLIYNTTTNVDGYYKMVTKDGGKAGDCISCRVCEGLCPQNIEIADTLAKASALFD